MILNAMQRMELADQLSDLMEQQGTAKGLDRMTLAEQIADVMIQLGFGGNMPQPEPVPETSATAPAPEPAPQPEIEPEKTADVPQVVTDFLAGKHNSDKPIGMVAALQNIEPYIGQFLTFEQAVNQCAAWQVQSGFTIDALAA